MSLTLHLLRHAKSSWAERWESDRERGLNARGKQAAPRMGAALAKTIEPMVIHASPARRAQLTLAGLCDGWPALGDLQHITVEALYTFSAPDIVDWLRRSDSVEPCLFLIGHNPAFTELINFVCGRPAIDNLPTAGYVQLEVGIESWRHLQSGCGELVTHLLPRELAG